MKILITGAAGCVGAQTVNKLISTTEHHIFATDIRPNPFQPNSNLEYQQLDICKAEFADWVHKVSPDMVVHLASVLQTSATLTRDMAYEIDVVATKHLLNNLVDIGTKKIIVTTSGAAYGYYPENKYEITEDRQTRGNPDYFYSAHKAEVESILQRFRNMHRTLKQVTFRPGAILGPNFAGPIVDLFQQKRIVGLMGYDGPFNFIWSEDVVDYIIEALETDIVGEYNIAGDGVLSMRHIAEILGKPYMALPELLIKAVLAIAKPLKLSQYGPEQTRFIKYRPVMSNEKLKSHFKHQPRYDSQQVLEEFIKSID